MDVRSHVPYPPRAQSMGLSGDVMVEFVVGAEGEIKNISVVQSTNAIFNRAAIDAVGRFKCSSQAHEARVRVPFAFRLES
jgi:protein TonB